MSEHEHLHEEDHCGCGCGHDHEHDEHEHHHHHHDECGCGCGHDHHDHVHEEHEHHHDHGDSCGCGHDHHDHDHHEHEAHEHHAAGPEKQVFILENLGCANCAAKMERRINELDDVAEATITFSTKQLRITGKRLDSLLPQIQEICASIESEVKVVPKDPAPKATAKAENKKDEKAEQKKTLTMIAAGAVLFVIGEVMEHMGVNGYAPAIVNVIAYMILGLEIVITAVKNLTHGQVFDENFLMSIATLGAFAVGDFSEAVGVMLFYRIGEFFEDVAVERSRTQIMDAVDLRP